MLRTLEALESLTDKLRHELLEFGKPIVTLHVDDLIDNVRVNRIGLNEVAG